MQQKCLQMILLCVFWAQAQMELRDQRIWSLRDLLGMANEPPTSAGDGSSHSICGDTWYASPQHPIHPRLVGKTRTFFASNGAGLPSWLTPNEKMALRRWVATATAGENPILKWQVPVLCGTNLTLTLANLQELPESPQRLQLLTLRAKRQPDRPFTADHVKVMVEMDERDRAYFGACLCFFVDSRGEHYVALRWLREIQGTVLHPASRLVPLRLSPVAETQSYSVLPVSAIANGALIAQTGSRIWACLSPHEEGAYIATNFSNIA